LVVLSRGLYGNVMRISVPPTTADAVIDEGLDILKKPYSPWPNELPLDNDTQTVPACKYIAVATD
jgi:hypothetical protein